MDGVDDLDSAAKRLGIDLISLIAETALWAHPEVHAEVMRSNAIIADRFPEIVQKGNAAWFPGVRRLKSGEKKGSIIDHEKLDDNTYANNAIKRAIGVANREICNYHTCHVWPNTCDMVRCHTVIANLVLLPSPLASLSDHHPGIYVALQFHSYELYGWHPEGEPPAGPQDGYPQKWREPEAFSKKVRNSIKKRRMDYLDELHNQNVLYAN